MPKPAKHPYVVAMKKKIASPVKPKVAVPTGIYQPSNDQK